MRAALLLVLTACACASSAPDRKDREQTSAAAGQAPAKDDIFIERDTAKVDDQRPVPKASAAEIEDFKRVWELYRTGDPRWPLERDRFKARSEAASYLLAGHLLRHYMQINALRSQAREPLVRVQEEIVQLGAPCAPYLINLVVLDRIPLGKDQYFVPDDITRRDCIVMLQRMGPQATPDLLKTLARPDIGVKGRRLTAKALGGTRDPRAYVPLVKLLINDPAWQVRADAAEALGLLGDRRALKPLLDAMRNDPDPAVGRRAAKARKMILHGR